MRSFDPQARTGEVFLDDGSVRRFDAAAFDASGLRLLRLGQRVRLVTDDQDTITLVTIATLRDPA